MRWAPCDDGVVDQLEVGRLAGVDRHVEVAGRGRTPAPRRAATAGSRSRRRRGRTPRPCSSTSPGRRSTSRAISSERSAVRMAQQMTWAEIGRPAAAASASPRRSPGRTTASTVASGDSRRRAARGRSGPRSTRRRRRRGRRPPRRRRARCARRVCITASVCSNVARYCSRSPVSAPRREPRLQLGDGRSTAASSRSRRRARRPSPGAARRRGGRAAAPSAPPPASPAVEAQTCMPLRHGTPACAGGRRAWPRTDTMISVTRYGVMYTNWLFGRSETMYSQPQRDGRRCRRPAAAPTAGARPRTSAATPRPIDATRSRARTSCSGFVRSVMPWKYPNRAAAGRHAGRSPVADDERGQAEEAAAADLVLLVAVGEQDHHGAAEPGQPTGDRHAVVAVAEHRHAEGVGGARALTGRAQAQAERRAPQHVGAGDEHAGGQDDVEAEVRRQALEEAGDVGDREPPLVLQPAERIGRLPAEQVAARHAAAA